MDFNLTEEHLMIQQAARDFAQSELLPGVIERDEHSKFPTEQVKMMAELGFMGMMVDPKYGGAGLDSISYVLAMTEIAKVDASAAVIMSVNNSLVCAGMEKYCSEEQKMKYLPKLATGEMMGCFGLTEPDHGSDPNGMITNFKDPEGSGKSDHVILNGAKMWISNAPFADIAIVWAKDEAGEICGLIVERGMKGLTTPETYGKWSLRASATGELVFDNVKVPKENIFPKVKGLKGPLGCLNSARYGISWGAIGAALDCYDSALRYSKERIQFGKPIASFQLTQKKLAEMITEITKAQLLCWRLGVLKNENRATPQQISLAKRNNVNMALQIAREARQIHGAMGITGEYPIMRHMMNLESVITYEGTHDIHLLITGYDVTGISAFE